MRSIGRAFLFFNSNLTVDETRMKLPLQRNARNTKFREQVL